MSCRSNFNSQQHLRVSVQIDENSRFVIALNRTEVSFTDIVSKLAVILAQPQESLYTKRFICGGCKRTLFARRERKERLPANCCPQRALLILSEPDPDFDDNYVYADLEAKKHPVTPTPERRVYITDTGRKFRSLHAPPRHHQRSSHSVSALFANVKKRSTSLPAEKRKVDPETPPPPAMPPPSFGARAVVNDVAPQYPRRESAFHYEELDDHISSSTDYPDTLPNTMSTTLESDDFATTVTVRGDRGGMQERRTLIYESIHSHSEEREMDDDYDTLDQDRGAFARPAHDFNGHAVAKQDIASGHGNAGTTPTYGTASNHHGLKAPLMDDEVYTADGVYSIAKTENRERQFKHDNANYAPLVPAIDPYGYDDDSDDPNDVVLADMHVRLVLPGSDPLSISIGRQMTIANFLQVALFNRKWFPIADIHATSCGSLIRVGDDWPSWTLDDCGVGDGDEIVVTADAPESVHVSVFNPRQFDATISRKLELDAGDWSWRQIQRHMTEKTGETFYSDDLTYQIHMFENEEHMGSCLAMLFLNENSGLKFEKSDCPQICVLKESDIMLLSGRDMEWALPSSVSIFESRWLLLLSGIATSDLRPEGVFVALDQRQFANTLTGEVFVSRENAIATLPSEVAEEMRGFVMLLEAGNRVPRWRLPRNIAPRVWLRKDIAVRLRDGRVQAVGQSAPDSNESVWTALPEDHRLTKNFVKHARKGRAG